MQILIITSTNGGNVLPWPRSALSECFSSSFFILYVMLCNSIFSCQSVDIRFFTHSAIRRPRQLLKAT